jgi:hypothetical protein
MSELRLNTDGHIIKLGADNDVTLTHVADTGILLNSTMQLQFNDSSQFINAPSATVLDINATDEIELNATLVDINANVEISGTATTTGVHTFSAAPVFPDGSIAVADLDIDGATDIGAAIVDADLFIVDDGAGGTNRKVTASRIKTYAGGAVTAINNATANELVTIGSTTTELDAESGLTYTDGALVIGGTTPSLTIGDAGAEDTKIVFDGNAQDYHIGLDDSADDLVIGLGSALGTTTHMSFDETGAVTKPLQPAARVTLSGNLSVDHNTVTKITFDTETYDKNGDFASNKFTAPVAGRYFIHCHAEIMDLADTKDFYVIIYKNGSETNASNEKSASSNYQTNSITDVLELAATDYIEFYTKHVHGSSRNIYAANTFGEVYLLG